MATFVDTDKLPQISEEELINCRKAFQQFDINGNGTIDLRELKHALSLMGQHPSDEELFVMMNHVDKDGSKEIEFAEFVQAIQINKSMSKRSDDEADTLDAFVALGGNHDKTGKVLVDRLRSILEEFEMKIDIDRIIHEVDKEGTGAIDYLAFKQIMT